MNLTERQKKIIKERPYRLRHPAGRNISVEFAHMPGKRISTKTDDPEEAIQFADRYLMNDGLIDHDIVPTLEQFAKDFFMRTDDDSLIRRDRQWKNEKNAEHYASHQGRLDNYILPYFGRMLVDGITKPQIERFVVGLPDSLADDSKNKIIRCMRMVMDDVARLGYRKDNPANEVKLINAEHEEREPFYPDEMAKLFPSDDGKLIATWGGLMWACYFLVFRDTGFRPGEVAGLQKRNYLADKGGVFTMQSVDSGTGTLKKSIKTTKHGQKYKTGLLSPQTCRLLDKHSAPMNEDDMLFISPRGNYIKTSTSQNHFRDVCDRIGVNRRGRVQYCIRHTFNTSIIGEVPEDVRRRLMGHTGDRPEYDHRMPGRIIDQLQPYREQLEEVWDVEER